MLILEGRVKADIAALIAAMSAASSATAAGAVSAAIAITQWRAAFLGITWSHWIKGGNIIACQIYSSSMTVS